MTKYIVSNISRQQKGRNKNVYVRDDESHPDYYLFSIHNFDAKNPIQVDMILDEESVYEQKDRFEFYHALEIAFRKLERVVLPKGELKTHLTKKGISSDNAQKAADYCFEHNLVMKNKEYATAYVRSKIVSDPMSKSKMTSILKNKGLTQSEIKDTFSEEGIDDFDTAVQLVEKKFKRIIDDKTMKTTQKVIYALQYRQFSWETIGKVLRKFNLPRSEYE